MNIIDINCLKENILPAVNISEFERIIFCSLPTFMKSTSEIKGS